MRYLLHPGCVVDPAEHVEGYVTLCYSMHYISTQDVTNGITGYVTNIIDHIISHHLT